MYLASLPPLPPLIPLPLKQASTQDKGPAPIEYLRLLIAALKLAAEGDAEALAQVWVCMCERVCVLSGKTGREGSV